MAAPVLAALLAVLLAAVATLSVSHSLHQTLHPDGGLDHHLCLACALAKGQVGTAPAAPVMAICSFLLLCGVRLCAFALLLKPDHLLLPSRAPPGA